MSAMEDAYSVTMCIWPEFVHTMAVYICICCTSKVLPLIPIALPVPRERHNDMFHGLLQIGPEFAKHGVCLSQVGIQSQQASSAIQG